MKLAKEANSQLNCRKCNGHEPAKLCERWTGKDNLSCLPENLFLVEKLQNSEKLDGNYKIENYLKACRICSQIYREEVYKFVTGSETLSYYKIPGNLANHCHCIGYLITVEILKDEKWCEGDSMYFGMEKETKMRCENCGTCYKESIYQNNFDGVSFQTYSKL